MQYAKKVLCATLSSALVVSGCASTGGGLSSSALTSSRIRSVPAVFDDADLSPGDALVVIRYPAFVDQAAETIFYRRYINKTIGDRLKDPDGIVEGAEQLYAAFLLKNHYFAVSIYKALKRRLPEDTVLLSPHMITYDASKGLTSNAVLSSEAVPHAITIDFTTYTFPAGEKVLDAKAVTFGDLVTPLAVVRTDHHALPSTNGLIAASSPFISTAWRDAAQHAKPISLSALQTPDDSHILIDFLDTDGTTVFPSKIRFAKPMSSKVSLGTVDILPVEKLQMDSLAIERLSFPGEGLDVDPFGTVYSNAFANRIVAYLNALDLPKTTAAAKQQAVAAFDYDAAHLYFAATDDNAIGTRVNFAERLLKAERRYLSGQSLSLEESMSDDEFGKELAELFVAEQDNLEQRREYAREQNTRTTLAILGALAAAGAIYGASKSGNSTQQSAYRVLTSASILAAGFSFMSSRTKKAQGRIAGTSFLSAVAPSLDASSQVSVDLLEGSEELTAATFPELQEKMLALYSSRMRSMDVSALPCTFSSPDSALLGTWYGPCDSGAATGTGYGVIVQQEAPFSIEYFGDTRGGYASGAGYLILSGGDALPTVSYEGQFVDGRANGAVTMTTTGKSPQTGLYENGKRVGRVPQGVAVPQILSVVEPEQVAQQ